MLTLQSVFFAQSVVFTNLIEAILLSSALYIFLNRAPSMEPLFASVFTVMFAYLTRFLAPSGMEVALFIFCAAVFTWVASWKQFDRLYGVYLGAAAAACIGARIDSAVFVLPALLFVSTRLDAKLIATTVLLLLGSVYLICNYFIFGTALPISGLIKSLGGLQINHVFFQQIYEHINRLSNLKFSILSLTIFGVLFSFFLAPISKPFSLGRIWSISVALGGSMHFAKIAFFSSWRIWEWYNYPLILALVASYYVLGPQANRLALQWLRDCGCRAITLLARKNGEIAYLVLCVLLATALFLISTEKNNYRDLNLLALKLYAPIFNGAPIAMGDRAGSIAYAYNGPVVQLEGLVNDTAYLEQVRKGADVRDLLCERGVNFVLDYEVDLGSYDEHRIDLFRLHLTQFPGPKLTVHRSEEIGKVHDPDVFDNHLPGEEGDDTLYIWRLSCE